MRAYTIGLLGGSVSGSSGKLRGSRRGIVIHVVSGSGSSGINISGCPRLNRLVFLQARLVGLEPSHDLNVSLLAAALLLEDVLESRALRLSHARRSLVSVSLYEDTLLGISHPLPWG